VQSFEEMAEGYGCDDDSDEFSLVPAYLFISGFQM
jgi:hypothetical protein